MSLLGVEAIDAQINSPQHSAGALKFHEVDEV